MSYPLDDADLALIEINTTSPLVQSLVEEIRRLRDDNAAYAVAVEEVDRLKGELECSEEEIACLRSEARGR